MLKSPILFPSAFCYNICIASIIIKEGTLLKQLSLMLKPASSLCNMRCQYCFYSDVSSLREQSDSGIMTPETRRLLLEHTFSQLSAKDSITIAFQGGEPTMAGLEWFEEFIQEVSQLAHTGVHVSYALQTNGLLLDQAWFSFLKKNRFLVGLSLDGLREFHDANRLDAAGKGTFLRVMKVKEQLDRHQIPYNVLMVLTNSLARHPQQVWNFIKKQGLTYVQFIPCLAPLEGEQNPFALTPRRYASFYIQLFDLWFPEVLQGHFRSIKLFDDLLNLLAQGRESACGITGKCRGQLIAEADGSMYPCDFYALDQWCLGNLSQNNIREIYEAPQMSQFCSRPRELPAKCSSCSYTSICGGGCPRMLNEVFYSPKDGFCGHQAFLASTITRLLHLTQLL